MFTRQTISDLTEVAQMIVEEIALNMMDGLKAQWIWAGELTDIVAQLRGFYADGWDVDTELLDYCSFVIEACLD